MKICRYTTGKAAPSVGLVDDRGRVVALRDLAPRAGLPELASAGTVELLRLSDDERVALGVALEAADDLACDLDELELAAPMPDPEKILCLGLNYRDHAAEAGLPLPSAPILFPKFREALIGHGAKIVPPVGDHAIDYEAELAVVIARGGRDVALEEAMTHVGGYMPFNDVSARDLQNATTQWTAGKAIDTFGPSGPYLTTADEVPDPQALRIQARVNGVTVQDGMTADMIFGIAEQIAFISSLMTLAPGDIIATGTPAGVGFTRTPPLLLTAGDVVEVEIEGLGTLRNSVGVAIVGGAGAASVPVEAMPR